MRPKGAGGGWVRCGSVPKELFHRFSFFREPVVGNPIVGGPEAF